MGVRKSDLIHTPTTISSPHSSTNPLHPLLPNPNPNPKTQTSLIPSSQSTQVLSSMAAINSSVLACSYAVSGAGMGELTAKLGPGSATPLGAVPKPLAIRAQLVEQKSETRRAAMVFLAATLFSAAAGSAANAGIIDEYLEKSKANKELNDKKRLATSGANFARAYTVQFGTCKFPENFTGCQDLAKQKKVPFLSEDIELECEGKDKYKCGSNVFWKW